MNDQENRSIEEYSPDALMQIFARSRLGMSIAAAVVGHVVVIGLLSLPTLLADPQGQADPAAPQSQAQTEAQRVAEEAAARSEDGEAAGEAQTEADGEAAPDGGDGADADGGDGQADAGAAAGDANNDGQMTPVERRTSDAAAPDEIPDEPDLPID